MVAKKKKSAKDKKKKKFLDNDVLKETEKVFYELQITDLNRKLARSRLCLAELEEIKIQLENKICKLDGDHGEIISYLKRNLMDRQLETTELQSRLAALTELNKEQLLKHEEEIAKYKEEYIMMQEQLTSEIKLITGKLNALEEFRMQRDELMEKFENLQIEFDEQDKRYMQMIYDLEKKAILGKALLKIDMEERLFKLSHDFQNANQMRIAATSQRVFRENIIMNNEINQLIASTNELDNENLLLKERNKDLVSGYELIEQENYITVEKFELQSGIIRKLTDISIEQKKILDDNKEQIRIGFEYKRELEESFRDIDFYTSQIKILENNLKAARYHNSELTTELSSEMKMRQHLELLVDDARLYIQSILVEFPNINSKLILPNKENLLDNLMILLAYDKADVCQISAINTVSSITQPYQRTDGGNIFKTTVFDKPPLTMINATTYLGPSFDDFLKLQDDNLMSIHSPSIISKDLDYVKSSSSEEALSTSTSESKFSDDETNASVGQMSVANIQDIETEEDFEDEFDEIEYEVENEEETANDR